MPLAVLLKMEMKVAAKSFSEFFKIITLWVVFQPTEGKKKVLTDIPDF